MSGNAPAFYWVYMCMSILGRRAQASRGATAAAVKRRDGRGRYLLWGRRLRLEAVAARERAEAGSRPALALPYAQGQRAATRCRALQGQVELDMRGDIGQGGNRVAASPIESSRLGRA